MRYFDWNNEGFLEFAIPLLQKNQVFIGMSDTVFGLFSPATAEGCAHLNRIKGRVDKPYIILIADFDQVQVYVDESNYTQWKSFLKQCWPGPVTIVMQAKKDLPHFLSSDGTIALRIPQHDGLQRLLHQSGPLFSTSANRSGKPVPYTAQDIDSGILDVVFCVVVNKNENMDSVLSPSTIIDATGDDLRIIRQGAYFLKWVSKES